MAIFVRVSTRRQDNQRQINDLQAYAKRNNYQVVEVIQEVGSATRRKRLQRPELEQLLQLARLGKITKLLVTEVSRLGRRPAETLELIEQLTELNVSIYSQNFGLETLLPNGKRNPAASLIFLVFAELARVEAEGLADRIRSGQQQARSLGKNIGRPTGTTKNAGQVLQEYPQVVKLLKSNYSIRQVAKLSEVSTVTVQKVKKALAPATGK
ncbi:recombinase family protein [Adhaeribacter arboris]|uniref:recombinase family protein n=1 Tax=Adhaeribacter arboris TaxID=2072846 RepID=UPI001E3BDFC1|nr:recombinase family protein [Adhaeribacter arboris]